MVIDLEIWSRNGRKYTCHMSSPHTFQLVVRNSCVRNKKKRGKQAVEEKFGINVELESTIPQLPPKSYVHPELYGRCCQPCESRRIKRSLGSIRQHDLNKGLLCVVL